MKSNSEYRVTVKTVKGNSITLNFSERAETIQVARRLERRYPAVSAVGPDGKLIFGAVAH